MSAVSISSYYDSIDTNEKIFSTDKPIVIDSKVLMLDLETEKESFYISGILNSDEITNIIDSYAISTNRGVDILKNVAIPKFNKRNEIHIEISNLSKKIHKITRKKKSNSLKEIKKLEKQLNDLVKIIFGID